MKKMMSVITAPFRLTILSCIRLALIILNVITALASLAILSTGLILRFSEPADFYTSIPISDILKEEFNIPKMAEIKYLPLVNDIGIVLIFFGIFLFCTSLLACCGAYLNSRSLLLLFAIFISVLVLAEVIVAILILSGRSRTQWRLTD